VNFLINKFGLSQLLDANVTFEIADGEWIAFMMHAEEASEKESEKECEKSSDDSSED